MENREKIYIWESMPVHGYGAHYILIVKANNNESAYKNAVDIIKTSLLGEKYKLPEDINSVEQLFMMMDAPGVYYLSHFSGKLIDVYE